MIQVEFPAALSGEAFERREQTAGIAAAKSFLTPRSVAVVGASRRPGTVGAEIVRHLVEADFGGGVSRVWRANAEPRASEGCS